MTPSFEFAVERLGPPAPDISAPNKSGDTASDVTTNGDSPYAKHYRPDAEIWSLYVKETKAEDKELVELWETGLIPIGVCEFQLLLYANLEI
jgi:hypothetical protein